MGLESYLIRLSPGCRYFIKVIQFITSGLHYYYNKVSEKNMGFISKVYPYLSEKDREALMEDKVASMRLNALFKKIDEHLTYIDSNSSPNSAELKKLGVRGIDMVEQHHLDVSYLTLGQIPQTLLSLREKEEACSAGAILCCWVINFVNGKSIKVRVLVDSGANLSMIGTATEKILRLKGDNISIAVGDIKKMFLSINLANPHDKDMFSFVWGRAGDQTRLMTKSLGLVWFQHHMWDLKASAKKTILILHRTLPKKPCNNFRDTKNSESGGLYGHKIAFSYPETISKIEKERIAPPKRGDFHSWFEIGQRRPCEESQAWFLRTAVIERIPFWISCDEGSRVPIWGIDGKNSFICVVQNPFKCSASSKFLLNLSFNCQRISRDCAKLSFPFNQQDDLPTYQNKVVIGLFSQGKALNKKGTYRPSNSNLEIQFPNRRKCLCNRVKAIPQTKVI
ncbi:unnamed protein product [Lepeophtheirus salmonis]|uniref:(salmon louse) hypothetical protein n=1 Tax=Lepeophtheirus salmonis TaxID=72036 RepID=A0A7R8H2V4_LEPSM|nr:unnamed protein product [Lepeophtheirus salmonis]CAF2819506.1 unnamed protein product [Lepeophtheirus salmonis]